MVDIINISTSRWQALTLEATAAQEGGSARRRPKLVCSPKGTRTQGGSPRASKCGEGEFKALLYPIGNSFLAFEESRLGAQISPGSGSWVRVGPS
jgi:hypothetical protein